MHNCVQTVFDTVEHLFIQAIVGDSLFVISRYLLYSTD